MVDLKQKYVRVTNIKDDKYVEFDFGIDDPEIFVELVLPFEMFETFCENNKVTLLPPEDNANSTDEYERMMWRIGNVGNTAFK